MEKIRERSRERTRRRTVLSPVLSRFFPLPFLKFLSPLSRNLEQATMDRERLPEAHLTAGVRSRAHNYVKRHETAGRWVDLIGPCPKYLSKMSSQDET